MLEQKSFEAEKITVKGAIFGRFVVNSVCISFKSEERKQGEKYMFGSNNFNQITVKINRKWELESIKEIVLRRYNLIRQGIEIYFDNSKSVFFTFFQAKYQKEIVQILKMYKNHKGLNFEIVEKPEIYFQEKKFQEKWLQCEISNFEYLMIVNKYGGRSFNDLSQYPVFPWIICDYDSKSIDLSNKKSYRPLDNTIAGITAVKRAAADEKYKVQVNDSDLTPFQFGTHYLARRMVLGYLQRLEPYSSLLIKFERGYDAANRMFHIIKNQWSMCNVDLNDNKELIPEFFYFPEIFGNYNLNSYGLKDADENISFLGPKVRVDQVIFPSWAKNNHYFIQMNALAMESKFVSENINLWIDLIFGEKQQNIKSYNKFKHLCDEGEVAKNEKSLEKHHVVEIQEFGCNPIKIFKEKHPGRDKKLLEKACSYNIFPTFGVTQKKNYISSLVASFQHSIANIMATDTKIFVVLHDQTIIRSKDDYNNNENKILFEKKYTPLYPFLRHNMEGIDIEKTIIILDPTYIITCRHYDNSCKIFNIDTGEIHQNLYFHKVNYFYF